MGPSGILAVRGVSGLAIGFGARRLGASFAGTRVMATTADFFCSAHRLRWAAAIRSRASTGSARFQIGRAWLDVRVEIRHACHVGEDVVAVEPDQR
ncbi:MAG: hypothetical protein ACJ72H_07680, partial [Candidatus Sulfotelmatobacter sp.]